MTEPTAKLVQRLRNVAAMIAPTYGLDANDLVYAAAADRLEALDSALRECLPLAAETARGDLVRKWREALGE